MKAPTGTWHCHTIDQFQSEESRAHGVHPDADDDAPPTPAHQTELRGVTLELAPDGRYAIRGPALEISSGTWALDGDSLALAEDPDQPRYFEKLRRVEAGAKSVRVEFTLIPDAHDGLDVMALEFQSKPPKAPKTTKLTPAGVLETVAAGKWKSRQQAKLDELPETERLQIHRAAWDAFVAGTFASDPSARSYRDQIDFLCEGARLEPPAPSHRHLVHAMNALDGDARPLFSNAIATALVRLPASDDDALVAAAMGPAWLDVMAFYRFLGGVPRAWDRALFPQPAFDDACRAYLARPTSIFSANFDDALRLLDGRPELPAALLRHHGSGALTRSHTAIAARGAGTEARVAAAEQLRALEPRGAAIGNDPDANTRRLGALAIAVLFRETGALPAIVLGSLAHGGNGYSRWIMSDEEKALLRTSIEPLPESERALVAAAFHL